MNTEQGKAFFADVVKGIQLRWLPWAKTLPFTSQSQVASLDKAQSNSLTLLF